MNTNLAHVHIIKKGLHLSLQDLGRSGLKHLGISGGGVADEHAARWANHLLDNNKNAALLQALMGNIELVFSDACQISICGADCDIYIDTKKVSNWSSFHIAGGSMLKIGMAKIGLYSYIAIRGGFQTEKILGSVAMNMREQLGFNNGQALQSHHKLAYLNQPQNSLAPLNRQVHWQLQAKYDQSFTLRVICHNDFFNLDVIEQQKFFSQAWLIHSDSDQMGIRFQGDAINIKQASHRLSAPLTLGAIQLPTQGLPIVLMKQHQSIGGYPVLGYIYRSDLYRLAQLRPGQKVRFIQGNINEAQAELISWLAQWNSNN